jgi:hypothetical protein
VRFTDGFGAGKNAAICDGVGFGRVMRSPNGGRVHVQIFV